MRNAIVRTGLGLAAVVLLAGCGSAPAPSTCTPTGFAMEVRPVDPLASPDHAAPPPGNQQLFEAALGPLIGPEPCIFHPLYQRVNAQWTASDPVTVSISSANDATNGLATCLATTVPGTTVSATLTNSDFTETVATPIACK